MIGPADFSLQHTVLSFIIKADTAEMDQWKTVLYVTCYQFVMRECVIFEEKAATNTEYVNTETVILYCSGVFFLLHRNDRMKHIF